jgi:hypothetical protein
MAAGLDSTRPSAGIIQGEDDVRTEGADMLHSVPIENASRDLKGLVEGLPTGESVTLVSGEGTPLALLVSLKTEAPKPLPASEWMARWDRLSRKISRAWKTEKSAAEVIAEMRR